MCGLGNGGWRLLTGSGGQRRTMNSGGGAERLRVRRQSVAVTRRLDSEGVRADRATETAARGGVQQRWRR